MSQIANTTRRTYGESGGYVFGRCAGYTYDGAAYCPDCAADIEVPTSDGDSFKMNEYPADTWDGRGFGVGVVSGMSEWDAPGPSCDVCHLRLDVTTIEYEGEY